MDAVTATHLEVNEENRRTFAEPEGLSPSGRAAYRKIVEVLAKADALYSGGCKVFYSPQEWHKRGERYGLQSELIVVYDGGNHRRFFDSDGLGSFTKQMVEALNEVGLYFEPCTGWYCAVYPSKACQLRPFV